MIVVPDDFPSVFEGSAAHERAQSLGEVRVHAERGAENESELARRIGSAELATKGIQALPTSDVVRYYVDAVATGTGTYLCGASVTYTVGPTPAPTAAGTPPLVCDGVIEVCEFGP